jgi:DNA-directed RNA polymerase subunit H (RpoH/RPB5)
MEHVSALRSSALGHILIRSRTVILDLLERRGYNVDPYRKFVGPDLLKLIPEEGAPLEHGEFALRIDVVHRNDSSKHAIVDYRLDAIKQAVSQGSLVKTLLSQELPTSSDSRVLHNVSPETTEVIILYIPKTLTEESDPYDKCALDAWMTHKLKLQFFPIQRLAYNPLEHMLQPQFEVVPDDQVPELLKHHYARSKTQFPFIRFHADMASRCLGLVPGQVVKITRPSPSSGSYVLYRVCTP